MIYLKLVNKFKFQNKISHQDPSLYIDRWARLLEFDPLDVSKVAEDACNLVMGFKRDWMAEGRKPSGICGAALLLAARMNNYHRTMHEIIQVVKVSDSTINKRLQEFKDTASSTLTVEEFRSAWSKGPDFWEGMAQPLPPAKMRNDALLEVEEKELKRSLKRERDENASDGDGSVENSDDTSEEEEDEEEEDQDGVQPGKKAMIAASKKMRANLRKVQLSRDKRDRLEMLRKARQTPTSSRADSMPLLPEGTPAPEGSASGSGNQELPNFKMDNVEPVYMGKKKEAEASALVRRERGKKDKGKGKEKEGEASGTQNGGKKKQTDQDGDVTMEDGDADKEEGDEALKRIDETDKEEGDQTDKEEGDQTDKEEGDQTDKEEGGETDHEYEQPRRPIQSRDDIVDPAVEREIQEALDQDLEFGTSADGQKEIKTAAQKMKELAAADKQKASRAAQAARGDWALGLDDEELDGYILDEYGFEAKKRIWWHNNRDYMVKRYGEYSLAEVCFSDEEEQVLNHLCILIDKTEKKQKEDGLARPQTTGGRKRTKPGPAASAYDATMTMVKGKSFSRNINYEALRKAFQEDSDEEEEEKKLQAVNGSTPSSIKPAPRAEGSRSGLPAATSAGAESDKEEGPDANNAVTTEGEDKEEGDDDKDGEEDDKEDEDMDDEGYSEFAPVEEEFDGFEEAD